MSDVLNVPAQPTPAEYLVQKACHWRVVERELIANRNTHTTLEHHLAKLALRKAVDLFVMRGGQP